MQRADVVNTYLVSNGGFEASKITAADAGETSPSQAGSCLASLPMADLRACLQPDRRIDVDVSGTG